MIEITNNNGGTIVIATPPYQPKPTWLKKFKVFGLWFAVSNGRIKRRRERLCDEKQPAYNKRRRRKCDMQGRRCAVCGKEVDTYHKLETHHVLPVARFPELQLNASNMLLVCHDCHKEIHCNPFVNVELMEAKAKELGIDLCDHYKMHPDCHTA